MIGRLIATLLFLCLLPCASAQGVPGFDIEGPFVRVKRNEDGSRTVFKRGNDKKTLTKSTYTASGNLTMKTVYRLDDEGNPLKCDIYDGLGNRLYKTSFGYSKRPGPTFGKLVQELLYDARTKRYFPGTRNEKPVHMFQYRYNPDGSAQLPIGITLVKGKMAEEIFGKGGGALRSQALPDLNELEEGTEEDARR
ncbi:hypothetical protein HAHE_13280 [Haloferula helveola]|uniref:DUF3108 domain-containing protein n=1 Tax=Haloferula helveola TaxID=490095 RepID=A0ABM7RCH6_9BACT|nr:hypothetical protein HAHE_13280 [Haloferula helveola]